MKKLIGVSLLAMLAIGPLSANAEVVSVADPVHDNSAVSASTDPGYALAEVGQYDGNVATAGYVKGAYNAAMKAINKVAATADSAVQSVAEGTTNGTIKVDGAEVAVHGLGSAAYTASTNYATAAQGTKADNAETAIGTMANLDTTATDLVEAINEVKATADGALTSSALTDYAKKTGVTQTITNSTISGTVPVLTAWGNDNSTNTVAITASITGATYAEPAAQQGGGN